MNRLRGARPLIVLRFDAGDAVGMGHAVRCLALAQAMEARGARIAIAANGAGQAVIRRAMPGTNWLMRSARTPRALRAAWRRGCDALIVDSYDHDADFEHACRGWAARIVAIDDLPVRRHACDLVLDQTLGRRSAEYRPMVPPHTRILTGHRYAMLRPMFLEARRSLRRTFQRGDRRVLVTLGGGDQSARTVKLLGARPRGVRAPSVTLLAARAAATVRARDVDVAAGDFAVARRFALADVALTAAGSTTWEMCCLGLPMILMPIAANQRDVAAALVKRRLALLAPAGDARHAWHMAVALLDDPRRRRAMSEAARRLIDGRGAARAAAAVLAVIEGSR